MNQIFDNRETSIFILIAVTIIAVLLIPSVRKFIPDLIKSALAGKLVTGYICMLQYVGATVYALYWVGLWNMGQLKNTIIWVVASGFSGLFSVTKVHKTKGYFKNALKDIFKITVVSEFFIGLFTFSLLTEIIAIPLLVFLVILKVVAEKDLKYTSVLKVINGILKTVGLFLIIYTCYHLIADFKKVMTMATFFDFLTPILLSILFLPFIYMYSIDVEYDSNFALLASTISEDSLRRYAKRMTLIHFNFLIDDLERWRTSLFVHPVTTRQEVKKSIEEIKMLKEIEKNPPQVSPKQGWSPYKAKDFLVGDDITTGYYKDCGEDEWMASSRYIQLDDSIIPNNMAYYVEGNRKVAKKLKLSLAIHSPGTAGTAHQRFLGACKLLYKNAVKRNLPQKLENALLQGRNAHSRDRNINIMIRKDVWSGHKLNGYGMFMEIEIEH